MREVRVGCCGFPVAMGKYFELFDVVEVQKTFYKPPEVKTAEKWRKSAPENFEFAVKAWQVITHPPTSPTFKKAGIKAENCGFFRPTKEVFDAWEKTRGVAKALKSTFIVFQTPKSFSDNEQNMKNMREFFSSIEREFCFGFEPRGWKDENVRKICEELELIHVVDPFVSRQLYGDFHYYRLHGYDYKHKYSEEELENLLRMTNRGYVMFNNVHMLDDALRFKKLAGLD